MKYEIYLIICMIALVLGVVGIFYTTDIIDRLRRIKNKSKFIRIGKIVGFILSIVSLSIIYMLSI